MTRFRAILSILALASCLISVGNVSAQAPDAAAGDDTLLLFVGDDERLERAFRIALEPWNVRVRRESRDQRLTIASAAALAARLDAAHVVWIEGHTLWLYDAVRAERVGRRIAPVEDAVSAAALSLTLKTMMRHDERSSERPPLPAFELAVSIGARVLELDEARIDPRVDLRIAWVPRDLGQTVALGAELSTGTGSNYAVQRLDAHYWSAVALIGLIVRSSVDSCGFELALAVGGQLGYLNARLDTPGRIDVWRVNPILATSLAFSVRVDSVRLVVRPRVDVPLIRQRFYVDGVPSLAMGAAALEVLMGIESSF